MVVTVEISDFAVMKTLIDKESLVDILYWKTFQRLGFLENLLKPYPKQIVGFSEERVDVKGYVKLETQFRKAWQQGYQNLLLGG